MADALRWNETLVDRRVTYHVEIDGRLFVIENVPARVNIETRENHFSPETIERLHRIIREQQSPSHHPDNGVRVRMIRWAPSDPEVQAGEEP